jgi:hypothetical protein
MPCSVLRTVPLPPHSFLLADQPVLQQAEDALLISGHSDIDIISRCAYHNRIIPWEDLMYLDAQTRPSVQPKNTSPDPLEQFLNLDLVNPEYDGPVCFSN